MCSYTPNEMSSNCEALYKRGVYFIETGTAQTFTTWAENTEIIKRYAPSHVLRRIGDLINKGDTDSATTLWLKVCEFIEKAPIIGMRKLIFNIVKICIAAMAIYSFFSIVLD